jgi:hypothetical protein
VFDGVLVAWVNHGADPSIPPTTTHEPQVFDLQKVDLREALQLYAQLKNPITLLVRTQ